MDLINPTHDKKMIGVFRYFKPAFITFEIKNKFRAHTSLRKLIGN